MTSIQLDELIERTYANGNASLACNALGWPIVPWRYDATGRKHPTIKGWTKGAALTLREDIESWFSQHLSDYAGILTGPQSGVFVLDVDPRNGGTESLAKLQADYGPLPVTFVVKTPSGGWHYYLGYPTDGRDIRTGQLDKDRYPGIDVRGYGGFVGAPGALTDRGRYEPPESIEIPASPSWLVDIAERRPGRSEDTTWSEANGYDDSPSESVDQLVEDAADVAPGGQDDWLFRFLCRLRNDHRSPEQARELGWRVASSFVLGDPASPWTEQHVNEKVARIWANPEYVPREIDPELQAWADNMSRQVQAEVAPTNTTAVTSRLVPAGDFVFREPEHVPALWGTGDDVLWPEGEGLMINGHQGVGKTTIAQQLMLHRVGILEGQFMGFDVAITGGKILALAMDRPRQFARSLRRMVTQDQWQLLNDRILVWKGPLPFNPLADKQLLANFVQEACPECDSVIVDSVKDLAPGIAKDEVGAALNSAWQEVIAREMQLLLLHHERKAEQGGRRRHALDDVYGSTWLTSGLGSVIALDGDPGDPTIELQHLKQPAAPVGPLRIRHDHGAGKSFVVSASVDLFQLLIGAGDQGVTAETAAQAVIGRSAEKDKRKVKRQLHSLIQKEMARKVMGRRTSQGAEPDRWVATEEARWAASQGENPLDDDEYNGVEV